MNETFKIQGGPDRDEAVVQFGPLDPETGIRLSIPRRLSRKVSYPDLNLQVFLSCAFSGERLEIEKMAIEAKGSYVASRDLTQLSLPHVMYAIVSGAVPEAKALNRHVDGDKLDKPEGPAFLATLYWFEHAGWGAPRARIMSYMDWSRANANFHLKKISLNFPLPGARSGQTQ